MGADRFCRRDTGGGQTLGKQDGTSDSSRAEFGEDPGTHAGAPCAAGFKASFLCPCGITRLSFEMTGTRILASDEEEGAWEESAWEQHPSWDLYPPCS